MKKLLLSTAILSLGTIGFTGVSTAQDVNSFSAEHFSEVYEKLSITQTATGLHTGDVQALSKAATPAPLYTGQGAVTMSSIRMYRY